MSRSKPKAFITWIFGLVLSLRSNLQLYCRCSRQHSQRCRCSLSAYCVEQLMESYASPRMIYPVECGHSTRWMWLASFIISDSPLLTIYKSKDRLELLIKINSNLSQFGKTNYSRERPFCLLSPISKPMWFQNRLFEMKCVKKKGKGEAREKEREKLYIPMTSSSRYGFSWPR